VERFMLSNDIHKLENLLLVSVPRDLTDDGIISLRRDILGAIRKHTPQIVLLDFSQVDICDSFFGRFIYSTSKMVELMGTEIIISGLQDAVIETMVELGMTLPEITAVIDLDEALRLSRSMSNTGNHSSDNALDQLETPDLLESRWLDGDEHGIASYSDS
jgi:rsbT antagonist protein RsbS